MITITRKFTIDYAHRLQNHSGKCRNLHGHRGEVEITIGFAPTSDKQLDKNGCLIDFSEIKSIIGETIDTLLDHSCILQEGDPFIQVCREQRSKLVTMTLPPSCENLAKMLGEVADSALFNNGRSGFRVLSCVFWESASTFARWEP